VSKANGVNISIEIYWQDWACGLLHEFRDLGFEVWMLGPVRLVRRWTPAR
jgi:hypothetical protein